jgi:hypothetical protein
MLQLEICQTGDMSGEVIELITLRASQGEEVFSKSAGKCVKNKGFSKFGSYPVVDFSDVRAEQASHLAKIHYRVIHSFRLISLYSIY